MGANPQGGDKKKFEFVKFYQKLIKHLSFSEWNSIESTEAIKFVEQY